VPRSLTTHIDNPKAVGVRLKEARQRAGLSQRQLAFPGCTAAYISRLEAGARVPSLQMINQLALRLDVSGQWLATGVEPSPVEPMELLEAEVALRLGDIDEAERHFRAHLQPGDPARAAALAGVGQIAFRQERFEMSIELLEESLAARKGRLISDPGAVDTLGRAHAIVGNLESAIALFERAVAEARSSDAGVETLRFSVLLANALIDAGANGRAEHALADVIQLAESSDDPVTAARVFWSQSRLHSMRKESDLAGRYARRALEILERTENDAYVGMAHHLLAYCELEAGNYADALALLERGRALFGSELPKRQDARFAVEEARALMGLGRHADAARAAAHALEIIEVMQPADRGRSYVVLSDVFLAAGDRERGRALLEHALDVLVDYGNRFALDAGRRLADLLEEEGDTAGALVALKRATEAAAAQAGVVTHG
jgi:tetratricopeptide (TPR) repeat protein